METNKQLVQQLYDIGISHGDILMVHSSYKSLGISDPEEIIYALLEVQGDSGTLFMPALSYQQIPHHIHDTRLTPSCVGYLPEYFRCRAGTLRSLHPTHSVSGIGYLAKTWVDDHIHDTTPCGPHSPFHKLLHNQGKILMIGCGLEPNTTMHAIEEYAHPPYLFDPPQEYLMTDANGTTFTKVFTPHNFHNPQAIQRYDRIGKLLEQEGLIEGIIGTATSYLIRADLLFQVAINALQNDPFYFVDIIPEEK